MSLINDALKRASQAQEQSPLSPASHLPLKPADPQVAITHGVGLALPFVFATLALLVLFFAWRFYQDRSREPQPELTAAASTGNISASVPLPADPPPAPFLQTAAPPPFAVGPAAVTTSTNAGTVSAAAPAATNSAPAAASNAAPAQAVQVQLPPLKLQGIVYRQSRGSAVINGRPVFVGDRIREFKVVAISTDTVTLVGAGQTNILTLPE